MKRAVTLGGAIAAMAVTLAAIPSTAQELRIGFLSTATGGGAIVGRELGRGWKLGLKHEGWTKDGDKLGGVPTRVFYADDQLKPDVGVTQVRRFLEANKVHIVSGVTWSNVMMAVQRPVLRAGRLLVSSNAGPTPLAGKLCNPLFVSTSFVNDQVAEASGKLLTQEGVKTVVLMVPNYQAGKDVIAGFTRTYKNGKIVGRVLYKLGTADFQSELTRVRALRPEAIFVFAPGGMGIALLKQWKASGLNKSIKFYSQWTVSHLTLPAIGKAALGTFMADHWNPDLDNARNKRFIRDYLAQHKRHPSHFAVTAYDSAITIAGGIRAVKGNLSDMRAVARAIRKAPFRSLRGNLKFNANGFPIQPFWKLSVVKSGSGKPLIKNLAQIAIQGDSHVRNCPKNMQQ